MAEIERLKAFERGELISSPYEPERGRLQGPNWIREAVQAKIEQRYANQEELSLLIYANFSSRELEYDRVVEACSEASAAFYSVWVITDLSICSLSSTGELGALPRWERIEPE